MSHNRSDVMDMQCWVFRLAQERWHKTALECLELFEQYDVLSYIEDLYDLLHLSSYASALDEVEDAMRSQGAAL